MTVGAELWRTTLSLLGECEYPLCGYIPIQAIGDMLIGILKGIHHRTFRLLPKRWQRIIC